MGTMGEGVRELRVVHTRTGEVVRRIDVTGRPNNLVDKAVNGLLRNMHDDFHVEDSADDVAQVKRSSR